MIPPLPPFGIRNLCDDEPFSILQVNELQYQATIESHPDATFSYIDEDDGENIVVGSGLELKQRLEDAPNSSAPTVFCYDGAKLNCEDRLIHLFDIQRTYKTRAAWEGHHTAYQRNQKQFELGKEWGHKRDSVSSFALDPDNKDRGNEIGSPLQHTARAAEVDLNKALSEVVPEMIENLANVMQATSETLRKAAVRSRETNTSPIEDLLSGVSNIVTEIGSFGLGLLEQLAERSVDTVPKKDKVSAEDSLEASSISVASSSQQTSPSDVQEGPSGLNFDYDSLPSRTSSPKTFNVAHAVGTDTCFCELCSKCKLQLRDDAEPSTSCHNCTNLDVPCFLTASCKLTASALVHSISTDPSLIHGPQTDDSILDQDTEDADFSRRYPPLMSLRRATTIAGLHDRFHTLAQTSAEEKGLSRHNSWTRRFPHRPVPQVLDAETQRRRDFARNCFPTQLYTPGAGPQSDQSPPSLKSSKPRDVSPIFAPRDGREPDFEPAYKPSPESDPVDHRQSTLSNFPESGKKTLPGAWPEFLEARSTANAPPGESSGAFFYRMMRDNPSRKQNHASESTDRLNRHRSFSRQQPGNNPFTSLHRSHTVSTATNPASRLNRPFDPLYPVPAPPVKASKEQSSTGPQGHIDWNMPGASPSPPKPIEKPSSVQRSFSPVWEDNLDRSKSLNTTKKERISFLDRHGESDSMYSPPPRHMRSVPNLAAKVTATPADATDRVHTISSYTAPRSILPLQNRYSPFNAMASDSLPDTAKPSTAPFHVTFQSKDDVVPDSGDERSTAPSDSHPPAFYSLETEVEPRRRPTTDPSQKCINALQDMGYGLDDENLRARLHVYAAAAGGNVTEAIDMIEEDQRAHFAASIEANLEEEW